MVGRVLISRFFSAFVPYTKDMIKYTWLPKIKLTRDQQKMLAGLLPAHTPRQLASLVGALEQAAQNQVKIDREAPSTNADTLQRLEDIEQLIAQLTRTRDNMNPDDRYRIGLEIPFLREDMEGIQATLKALQGDYAARTGPVPCYQYTDALEGIAKTFEQVFPTLRVSGRETSVFCRVAGFWFGQVLRVQKSAPYECKKLIKLRGELALKV